MKRVMPDPAGMAMSLARAVVVPSLK